MDANENHSQPTPTPLYTIAIAFTLAWHRVVSTSFQHGETSFSATKSNTKAPINLLLKYLLIEMLQGGYRVPTYARCHSPLCLITYWS